MTRILEALRTGGAPVAGRRRRRRGGAAQAAAAGKPTVLAHRGLLHARTWRLRPIPRKQAPVPDRGRGRPPAPASSGSILCCKGRSRRTPNDSPNCVKAGSCRPGARFRDKDWSNAQVAPAGPRRGTGISRRHAWLSSHRPGRSHARPAPCSASPSTAGRNLALGPLRITGLRRYDQASGAAIQRDPDRRTLQRVAPCRTCSADCRACGYFSLGGGRYRSGSRHRTARLRSRSS